MDEHHCPNDAIGVNVSMLDEGYEAQYEAFSCVID